MGCFYEIIGYYMNYKYQLIGEAIRYSSTLLFTRKRMKFMGNRDRDIHP